MQFNGSFNSFYGLSNEELERVYVAWCNGLSDATAFLQRFELLEVVRIQFCKRLLKIEFCFQPVLKVLDLEGNSLSVINIKQLGQLEELYVHTNKLKEIDVTNNLKLRILNVKNNQLSKIYVKHLKYLERLYLNQNLFKKVPELPPDIQILDVSRNRIADLSKIKLKQLK